MDSIFEQAIADAAAMKVELLKESLSKDAETYMLRLPADKAKETGFQDQLAELQRALSSGDLMNTLAAFGEEMTSALLPEHAWLNVYRQG